MNSPAWLFEHDKVEKYAYYKNLFSSKECDEIISYVKTTHTLKPATVEESSPAKKLSEHRQSNVVFLQPCEQLAWVYTRLADVVVLLNKDYFNFDLYGFTEGLQFTEYNAPGGKYDAHTDRTINIPVRKLSIVLQLTDPSEYDGGDFEIIEGSHSEKLYRDQGTLLAFPSYTMHAVTPLTRGTRHSLVGWISGPQFK
jgi:PKHD-type hydroxylase